MSIPSYWELGEFSRQLVEDFVNYTNYWQFGRINSCL